MLRRRTPSYPFRKPRDLTPEILQRFHEDQQKLALSAVADSSDAKLAAEKLAAQEVSGAPSFAPDLCQAAQLEEVAKGESVPASNIQLPASRTIPAPLLHQTQTSQEKTPMPDVQTTPEANQVSPRNPKLDSLKEMFPISPLPTKKPKRRPAIAKNTKQYLRAAPKFLRGRPDLARHSRKCQICHHPDRELIEDLYIHWHSAESILNFINDPADDEDYILDNGSSENENSINWVAIYRHAYALGLDEVRRRNLRFAFELLIEKAGDITPTSASIMAAARIYSCIDNDGRWSVPPKRVIVTTVLKREPEPSLEAVQPAEEVDPAPPVGAASPCPSRNKSESAVAKASCNGMVSRGMPRQPVAMHEIRNPANPPKIKEKRISNR